MIRVITRLNIGGPARQALLLSKALRPRFATTLLAGHARHDEGELTDPDVPVERVDLVRPIRPRSDLRALRQLRTLIKRDQPALVHTHMAKAGFLGRLAAISCGSSARTIHTFHGHVLDGYFNKAVEQLLIQTERFLARQTDVLVAVSPEIRDALLNLGIGRPDQYRIIPLGFDLDRHLRVSEPTGLLRDSIGIARDIPLIGIIGRLVPIKDVSTALRAVRGLDGVHLAVIGDGEARSQLEQEADDFGIRHRCHFTGWWHDIPSAMSDLDVVLLTSRNEGTPVSLIEASACARPIVATDVGGVRFVVEDGETGLLCPPRQPAVVARLVKSVLDDSDLAQRLGTAARERVPARFHRDRLIADIEALYNDVISAR